MGGRGRCPPSLEPALISVLSSTLRHAHTSMSLGITFVLQLSWVCDFHSSSPRDRIVSEGLNCGADSVTWKAPCYLAQNMLPMVTNWFGIRQVAITLMKEMMLLRQQLRQRPGKKDKQGG